MPFIIVRQDITRMKVDAIVNAANTDLQQGGGVCGAIFSAAGAHQLQQACNQLAPIKTGQAVITPGFSLPAASVIHTAGPIYYQWKKEKAADLLYSCYKESLFLAKENHCESIAFPLISSGIYGYPKQEALAIAKQAILDFLSDFDMTVYLTVFDSTSFLLSKELAGSVQSFIDDNYASSQHDSRKKRKLCSSLPDTLQSTTLNNNDEVDESLSPENIENLVCHLDAPFSTKLFALIDQKGKKDSEVYKKANIDRKLFSKIRSREDYTPKKATILALAIALELSLKETEELLASAGYVFSHASKFDVIIEYFILHKEYDIFTINEVLFTYNLPLLGC